MKHTLDKLIVVGDRVLIRPKQAPEQTKSGLYLPPGYKEKEEISSGYVVKVGPGYPIPNPVDDYDEAWKRNTEDQTRYLSLQAQEGDLAIYMQKGAIEIIYHNEKYYIIPHHSILMLERDDFSLA